jgi:hypothetical protein
LPQEFSVVSRLFVRLFPFAATRAKEMQRQRQRVAAAAAAAASGVYHLYVYHMCV